MRNPGLKSDQSPARDLRQELRELLDRPGSTGVVISGPIGSRKRQLLLEVLGEELASAVHLLCSPVLGEGAFGALSPLLIEFDAPLGELALLRYLTLRLESTSGSKQLVVVEEAQFLDAASAFVLSQLALAGTIKLILLAVGDGHIETVVASTQLGARLGHLSLGALTPSEVAEHVQRVFGKPPTSTSARAIASICGGNPLMIDAFLRAAIEQGLVVESTDWLVLTGPQVSDRVHLSSVVSEIQKRLNADDAEALEILALGGPAEAKTLQHFSGTDVGRLVGTGLVRFADDTRIEISAPIYSHALRDLVPPGRSTALWKRFSAQVSELVSSPKTLLWACESGEIVSYERFVDAIDLANKNLDFIEAWELCQLTGAWEEDPFLALLAARSMLGMGQHQLLTETIRHALTQTTDLALISELKSVEASSLWQEGDSTNDIGSLVSDWAQRTETIASGGSRQEAGALEKSRFGIEVLNLWLEFRAREDLPAVLNHALECERRSIAGSVEFLNCRDVRCRVLLGLGRFVEAADAALEALDLLRANSEVESMDGYQFMTTALRALIAVGDYDSVGIIASYREGAHPSLQLHWSGTLHLWAGFAAVQQGRWQRAGRLLSEARAELAINDPNQLYELAEALGAFESAQLHEVEDRQTPEYRETSLRSGYHGLGNVDAKLLAEGYLALVSTPANTDRLNQLIDRARQERYGHTEHQLLVMRWQMRLSAADGATGCERLRQLSVKGVSQRSNALAAALELTSSAGTEEVDQVAEELFSVGETGLGAELLASSLRGLAAEGNERRRGLVLRRLATWIQELGGTAWGPLRRVLHERSLTRREEEIISLVREGKSNKEIARTLTVSQRTVEGHLYRVFAKLGISGREELGATDT
ncbi:hypothetical protein DQ353_03930 [Arthrobacter sp. AQ5-05]|uniref:LuxR C-terminal-related transcriptional regulator n=1 Tax=Arthrobacter sp. AQ5-05 TaxID=2184581 RepID=UPI000DCD7F99|nr:LuxR C-terminal-related transcriptional regulator [Arthrobacter sp. AQ5-05]RAX50697.1 hypothetical protein DQ353_03930 [Arthrobacter sp. AQ5-05]